MNGRINNITIIIIIIISSDRCEFKLFFRNTDFYRNVRKTPNIIKGANTRRGGGGGLVEDTRSARQQRTSLLLLLFINHFSEWMIYNFTCYYYFYSTHAHTGANLSCLGQLSSSPARRHSSPNNTRRSRSQARPGGGGGRVSECTYGEPVFALPLTRPNPPDDASISVVQKPPLPALPTHADTGLVITTATPLASSSSCVLGLL